MYFKELFVKLSLLNLRFLKNTRRFTFYLSFLIMHVGGIYFINHKTKDYFPEGAGLLNLSMSTLKE